MVQPKKPPLSVRLPPHVRAALRAEAARRQVTVNALVLRAVRKEIGQWSDEEIASMKAKPAALLALNRIEPMRFPTAPIGSRLDKKAKR